MPEAKKAARKRGRTSGADRARGRTGGLQDRVNAIVTQARALQGVADDPAALRNAIGQLKATIGDLESEAPETASPMQLRDFFANVGAGMIDAQEELDLRSEAYVRSGPSMPGIFRIPKASAEFQFAVDTTEEHRFNVLLYGAGDRQQQSQRHRVSFEIVMAPPPPEMLQRLQDTPLLQEALVTGPGEREVIRERLARFARGARDARLGGKARRFAEEYFARVLAVRGPQYWALFLPLSAQESGQEQVNVDLAYVDRDADRVRLYKPWPPARLHRRFIPMAQLLLALSLAQAASA